MEANNLEQNIIIFFSLVLNSVNLLQQFNNLIGATYTILILHLAKDPTPLTAIIGYGSSNIFQGNIYQKHISNIFGVINGHI